MNALHPHSKNIKGPELKTVEVLESLLDIVLDQPHAMTRGESLWKVEIYNSLIPQMQHASLRCEVLKMAVCCQMHTPGIFSHAGMEVWAVWVFSLRDVTKL